jgi:hypothetical protein
MSNLTRRPPQSLRPVPQGRSIQRDPVLGAHISAARRPGILAAVRIESGAFAACSGVHGIARVSQAADAAFRFSPLAEDAYRMVVMAMGNFVRAEIEGLGFHEGER